MATKKDTKTEKTKVYSKEALLKSKKLNTNVLAVVLEDEKEYTIEQAEKLIDNFMKRKVK